jgi:hypothetical protein
LVDGGAVYFAVNPTAWIRLSDGFYDRRFPKPKFDSMGNMLFNPRVRDEKELSDNQMLRAHSRHDDRMAAP